MDRVVVDCVTGEQAVEPLSAEEVAEREAWEPPVDLPSLDERFAVLEAEVKGMRDRVADVEAISDEVRAMRDAIAPGRKD